MIGNVFKVEEIDDYGQPWVSTATPSDSGEMVQSHSLVLAAHEMECVDGISGQVGNV